MVQLYDLVLASSVELQHVFVELEQTASVRNCEQGDFELLGLQVEFAFNVHAHC